jgi:2'-5' RNA ligase
MARVQAALQARLSAGAVRWTKPDQFHVTLKFVGDVAVSEVDRLKEAVAIACLGIPPLDLRAAGMGTFPSTRAPRVIWVSATDEHGVLSRLHSDIDKATVGCGFSQPDGDWTSHVTIGRMNRLSPSGAQTITEFGLTIAGRIYGEWTARTATLMQSEIGRAGRQYTPLAEMPFANAI